MTTATLAIAKLLLLVNMFMPGAIPQGFIYSGTPAASNSFATAGTPAQGCTSYSGGTCSTNYTPAGTGNIVVMDILASAGSLTLTCADNATGGSSTYSVPINSGASISGYTLQTCVTFNVKAGVTALSYSGAGGASDAAAIIHEYSYTGPTPSADQISAINQATSTTITGGSITTAIANELLLSPYGITSGSHAATGSGSWVKREDVGFSSLTLGCLYQIVSSTGTYAGTATVASSTYGAYTWSIK